MPRRRVDVGAGVAYETCDPEPSDPRTREALANLARAAVWHLREQGMVGMAGRVWDGPRRKVGVFNDDHDLVQIGWWLEPEARFLPIMEELQITGSAAPVYVEDAD